MIQNLMPVFAIIALGRIFRLIQLTPVDFYRTSDRLVYFVLFPVMIFWKSGSRGGAPHDLTTICMVLMFTMVSMYVIAAIYIRIAGIAKKDAGTFSQAAYRFNTYLGMAVIWQIFGEEGVRLFSILIGFAITFANVLAVPTMIWFSGGSIAILNRLWRVFKSLVTNPLILACIGGLFYGKWVGFFPPLVSNIFELLSQAALPLALLSIGSDLSLDAFKGDLKLAGVAAILKNMMMPLLGFWLCRYYEITGLTFQVLMIYFSLPTATSIYILSTQLGGNPRLASVIIVVSTLASLIGMPITLLCI